MKIKFIFINLLFLIGSLYSQNNNSRLIGFQNSPYFDEQVLNFNLDPEVKIQINAPSPDLFDRDKPICIALFALPNGNTTEQTIGKIMEPGDDWHFDIQHIGAQTRFIRNHLNEYNLVTVYLENDLRSWPAWKAKYSDQAAIVRSIVDSIRNIFDDLENYVVLTGHSGGGRFTFSFLDAYDEIPSFVKRISFLDSNYGYEDEYGMKIVNWLNAGDDNYLSVIAYNDSAALYNGEPIVSPTGGTWYRSKMMREFMSSYFEFSTTEDDELIKSAALNNRIKIFLKKNHERKIFHTVQVELNGFIQGMVSGTSYEEVDYTYYGDRAYSEWIQKETDAPSPLNIPPRPGDAMTGSEFMQSVMNLTFEEREDRIFEEISQGNIPNFLRTLTKIKSNFSDANGVIHSVNYEVMPDYLAIGSDEDFCRIPMGPITAQKLADLFGAAMPTRKLVDDIYINSEIKLIPVSYYPVGNQNELVPKFIEHNDDIEIQRTVAGAVLGQLVGGIKKDVILSNKIVDPSRTHHVVIYGWHKLDGSPIQPLYNGHINTYVDYSHGIRFINSEMLIDSNLVEYQNILTDDILYKILSDENGAMEQPSYLKISGLPEKPNSFGIINYGPTELKILLDPDSNVESYKIFLSNNGIDFNEPIELIGENLIINDLSKDSIYYLKLKAVNQIGESGYTEVLAGIPSSNLEPNILIVNGFDRTTDGNTYNFIRQHGSAFHYNLSNFNSVNNEAVNNGLIDLNDYSIVDYILGEESTVDETFSSAEQSIVSNYLINGGNLFVTGSEIAWDLDYKGSTSDKSFLWNFLKMKYAADAPYNNSSTYYNVELVANDYFKSPSFFFLITAHMVLTM